MSLFNTKTVAISFAERFEGIKSVFTVAYNKAKSLQDDMQAEKLAKETQISGLQTEVQSLSSQMTENTVFMSNLEGLI